MSKYLDENGLLYFWQKLKALFSGKVDKENGKGLSTNDYTTAEKNKLAGIAAGATAVTVDSALSSSSTNPVQNKVINTALGNKVEKVSGKGLSTNDYTTTEKNKLAGIDEGANAYTLPTAAKDVLGGVKTSSTVTSASGYTACPIISGIPYYKNTTYSVATASANGLMSKEDYSKLAAFGAASTYALKTDITGMYKYKGSVATVSNLPSTGNTTGDVYNVESNGMNYAWDGSAWDALGEIFQISSITNSEIDTIVAS